MSYATNQDILTRIGPGKYVLLTDDTNAGIADESRVTQAREAAEAEIDSYAARRYVVPVDAAPDSDLAGVLRAVAVDLAVHRLYERRPPVPEDVRRRHDWAIVWLSAVATGAVLLAGAATPEVPAPSEPFAVAVGKGRVLTPTEVQVL